MDLAQYENEVWQFFNNLPESSFEKSHCLFCGPESQVEEMFHKGSMVVSRCQCGLVFNSRMPKQKTLSDFYKNSSALKSWSEFKDTDRKRELEKFGGVITEIKNQCPGSVLDIGCGNGTFLSLIHCENKVGIDESPEAIQKAKNKGLNVINSPIDEYFNSNDQKFDVITAFGVLEHLRNPANFIDQCFDRLNKNGTMFVCVPNFRSKVFKTLRKECFSYCPQHLYYFDQKTITRLFSEHGLRVTHCYGVEDESTPIAKWMLGIDPYKKVKSPFFYDQVETMAQAISLTTKSMDKYKIIVRAWKNT